MSRLFRTQYFVGLTAAAIAASIGLAWVPVTFGTEFTSGVIVFATFAIALAVPLTADVLTRSLGRFGSHHFWIVFTQTPQLGLLIGYAPALALVGIVSLAVFGGFPDHEILGSIRPWRVVSWLLLLNSLVLGVALASYLRAVFSRYLVTPAECIVEANRAAVLRILDDPEVPDSAHAALRKHVSGIGDVTQHLAANATQVELVESGLRNLTDFFARLGRLMEHERVRFARLVVPSEYRSEFLNQREDGLSRLFFAPHIVLAGLQDIAEQVLRVCKAGLDAGAHEASQAASEAFEGLVIDTLEYPEREAFLGLLMSVQSRGSLEAARAGNDSVLAKLAYRWFVSASFDEPHFRRRRPRPEYLQLTLDNLWTGLKNIVDFGSQAHFVDLASLPEELPIRAREPEIIWKAIDEIIPSDEDYELHWSLKRKANGDQEDDPATILDNRLEVIAALEARIGDADVTEEPAGREASGVDVSIERLVQHVVSEFVWARLVRLLFHLGGYCLFRRRYEPIQALLTYTQPSDADAVWGRDDLLPADPADIWAFLVFPYLLERPMVLYPRHHGNHKYDLEFAVLLLLNSFARQTGEQIDLWRKRRPSKARMGDLRQLTLLHEKLEEALGRLEVDGEALAALDITAVRRKEAGETLRAALARAISTGKEEILRRDIEGSLDEERLAQIARASVEKYHTFVSTRPLAGLFRGSEPPDDAPGEDRTISVAVASVVPRHYFVAEDSSLAFGLGQLGRPLAEREDSLLCAELSERAANTESLEVLAETIAAWTAPIALVDRDSLRWLRPNARFTAKYNLAEKKPNMPHGFAGELEIDGVLFSVFEVSATVGPCLLSFDGSVGFEARILPTKAALDANRDTLGPLWVDGVAMTLADVAEIENPKRYLTGVLSDYPADVAESELARTLLKITLSVTLNCFFPAALPVTTIPMGLLVKKPEV